MSAITQDQLKRLFPGASKSCLAVNSHTAETPEPDKGKPVSLDCADRDHTRPIDNPAVCAVLTIRLPTDEERLNKSEKAFLAWLRAQPETYAWTGVQCITLKLGDDCRYTPDFVTVSWLGMMMFWDVKGNRNGKMHVEDDALVKLKTAARAFRWATFATVSMDGTGWKITEVRP